MPSAPKSFGARAPKRARYVEEDDHDHAESHHAENSAQDNKMMAASGHSTGSAAGSGSAWEGQAQSLATDAFIHHQHNDMKNDIHHHLSVSSHLMDQGGPICSTWTPVPGVVDLLKFSMVYFTGNQMSGQANEFNMFYLCKMKSFTITFKDIIVALEASTNVGLTTMADVVTEWRRRPLQGNWAGTGVQAPPAVTDYPDWWQDWRPAVDGAVSFKFNVNSRRVPAWLANARSGAASWQDPTKYRTLRQFLFGVSPGPTIVNGANGGDYTSGSFMPSCWEMCAYTWEWLDYFFEWRARNCPNAQSGTNTSARYNIQIDTEWEMGYRLTSIHTINWSGSRDKEAVMDDK